ncbi:MAG: tetratricopeptide repeat protein [Armatimonadetes bacterium]|nr:tetratricopeptide repeat protein [Armatimonadota bacterium]
MSLRGRADCLAGLALAFALSSVSAKSDPFPAPVSVALADFQVSGLGDARYWLGPMYTEVLQRRLFLCADLLVTEGLQARMQPAPPRMADVPAVKDYLLKLAVGLESKYAIGGLIEDKGATLNVTCVVVSRERKSHWALAQEVPVESVFQPQVDLIVKRFMTNVGARATPAETAAMSAYDPATPLEQLQAVGEGWRQYSPEEPGRSLETWRRLLDEHPDCRYAAEAEASVSHFYRRLLYDRALAWYETLANTTEPDNPLAHFRLAELYADEGRWAEAEMQYLKAVNLRTTYVDAYLGLGRARMEQNMWQPAMAAFDAVLTLVPDHLKGLLNKGVVLYRRGMIPEALEAWAKVLKIDPNNETAKQYLANYGHTARDLP